MNMEELYIKNIENGIRAIKMGTKTIQDAKVNTYLSKLKLTNDGMYEELNKKYIEVVKNIKK